MKYIIFCILIALPIEASALDFSGLFKTLGTKEKPIEEKNKEKAEIYFNACRRSSLTTLLNIVKDAKQKYKELDNFSNEKCTTLRNITNNTNTWNDIKDPKFEGCIWGVDAAIGMNPADDELRKKIKYELCL